MEQASLIPGFRLSACAQIWDGDVRDGLTISRPVEISGDLGELFRAKGGTTASITAGSGEF